MTTKYPPMRTTGALLSSIRQPEYTGENRCLPCTAVNTVIGLLASAAVGAGLVWTGLASPSSGLAAGLFVFGLCLVAIYFRGYLVPGTPELTTQYFPPWLLAAFGKAPPGYANDGRRTDSPRNDEEFDPETDLVAASALEECSDRDDLCLTEEFGTEWKRAIERVKTDDADRAELLAILGTDEGEVRYEEHGDAFRAFVDDRVAGRWESRAAFLADLGAGRVLERYHPDWEGLTLRQRSQLLDGLRLFIDTCPSCGGTPEFETETVESCCLSGEVAAVSCGDCGARLFESDPI